MASESPPFSTPPESWEAAAAPGPDSPPGTDGGRAAGVKRKRGSAAAAADVLAAVLHPAQHKRKKRGSQPGPGASSGAPGTAAAAAASPRTATPQQGGGNYPELRWAEPHRQQGMLKVADLQALALYCVADGAAPQWVAVARREQIRRAVVLLVPGLEAGMFTGAVELPETNEGAAPEAEPEPYDAHADQAPEAFLPTALDAAALPPALRPLAAGFDRAFPVKAPGDERFGKLHSPVHAMLSSPLPKAQQQAANQAAGERTPVTELLASADDMLENDFVLHPAWMRGEAEREASRARRGEGWVDSNVRDLAQGQADPAGCEAGSITRGRTVYAVDCEMCMVGADESAVTRVSLVDWDGRVVLDELVKPDKPITDYLTPFSGITPAMLAPVTATLPDIQARLLPLLTPHTVLVGHSLESDLQALRLTHPFVADTTLLFPHPRGPPLKSSLRYLAQRHLQRAIQTGHGAAGHDSAEDARAALDLLKLKCERGRAFGDASAASETIFRRLARARKEPTAKYGAAVDRAARGMAGHALACSDDDQVVAAVRRAVAGDPDGEYVPGGGLAFVWARLKELEDARGWADEEAGPTELRGAQLSAAVAAAVVRIEAVRAALPPCSLLVVYSGAGDARELRRLQGVHRAFKREFATKPWDQVDNKWTDVEEQAMKKACARARRGVGLVCITGAQPPPAPAPL